MAPFLVAAFPAVRAAATAWRVWLAVVVVAAFAAVAGQSYIRGKTIRALTAEKATLEAEVKAVGGLLTDQNKAVETLREASDAQTKRAAKAAQAAQRALGAANARAEALALVQVPAACPDALEWLRATVSKSATVPKVTP